MSAEQEYDLQVAITDYLRVVFPYIIFRSDLGGVRLSKGAAIKVKRIQKSRGFPDLSICASMIGYSGLYLELKPSKDDVFIKSRERLINGKASHLLEQCAVLMQLREQGYAADLVFGYTETVDSISEYLHGDVNFSYSYNVEKIVGCATPEQWLKARASSPVKLDILVNMLGF